MADSLGPLPAAGPLPVLSVAGPSQILVELAQQPNAALLLAGMLAATVVGRGGNDTLLLRTQYGTLALKTVLALPPGTTLDIKVLPGSPPTAVLSHVEEPPAPAGTQATVVPLASKPPSSAMATEPPTQLDLGTELEATVLPPPTEQSGQDQPPPLAPGTRLLIRLDLVASDAAPTAALVRSQPATPSAPTPAEPLPATVASTADGKTMLATPLGTLALDRTLSLPEDTPLSLTTLATLPPAATRAPAELGTTIEATLLSPPPGQDAPVLAAGTRLLLKVAPLPPGTPAPENLRPDGTLIGTVIAGTDTETVVETSVGTIALERRLALPPGTLLALQQLQATPPDLPAPAPPGQRWPALDQALGILDRTVPDLAARLRADLTPASGQQLAGTLLFLMGAVTGGTWPGAKAAAALDGAGHHDVRLQLDQDVAELQRLADPPAGDWRVLMLPLLQDGLIQPVRLYLRRGARDKEQAKQGARFVLDIDLTRFGAVQLDGLVREQRFDLVLRSHRAIPPEMRQDITALFHDSVSAAGLSGDLVFTTASRFAVAPLEALRGHVGVEA